MTLQDTLKELEKKHGKKFEIDTEHQVIKKKGWKVTKDLEELGQDTVAQYLANTEGISLEKAKEKLKKAKEDYDKKVEDAV